MLTQVRPPARVSLGLTRVLLLKLAFYLSLVLALPLLSACDIVTADFKSEERAEWRKSYPLAAGARLEIGNINGKIDVESSTGDAVEVVAVKVARAGSPEGAREALERIQIAESVTTSLVRIETKIARPSGVFHGGAEVRYTVKVPAAIDTRFTTVNGGIDVTGLTGRVNLETTNGGIKALAIGGALEASTTNGGVEVELARVAAPGVTLECTNGGISLRLPADARATISASVTNGGIDTGDLALDSSEASRRRLEARLNGGGLPIKLSGTNGGISLGSR